MAHTGRSFIAIAALLLLFGTTAAYEMVALDTSYIASSRAVAIPTASVAQAAATSPTTMAAVAAMPSGSVRDYSAATISPSAIAAMTTANQYSNPYPGPSTSPSTGSGSTGGSCSGSSFQLYSAGSIGSGYTLTPTALYGDYVYFDIKSGQRLVASDSVMVGSETSLYDSSTKISVRLCSVSSSTSSATIHASVGGTSSSGTGTTPQPAAPSCSGTGMALYSTYAIDSTYSAKLTAIYGDYIYVTITKGGFYAGDTSVKSGSESSVSEGYNTITMKACSASAAKGNAVLSFSVKYGTPPAGTVVSVGTIAPGALSGITGSTGMVVGTIVPGALSGATGSTGSTGGTGSTSGTGSTGTATSTEGTAYALYKAASIGSGYTLTPTALYGDYVYFDIMKNNKLVASDSVRRGSSSTVSDGGTAITVKYYSASSEGKYVYLGVSVSGASAATNTTTPATPSCKIDYGGELSIGEAISLNDYQVKLTAVYGDYAYVSVLDGGKVVAETSVKAYSETTVDDGSRKISIRACSVGNGKATLSVKMARSPSSSGTGSSGSGTGSTGSGTTVPCLDPSTDAGTEVDDYLKSGAISWGRLGLEYAFHITAAYGDYVYFTVLKAGKSISEGSVNSGSSTTVYDGSNKITLKACRSSEGKMWLVAAPVEYGSSTSGSSSASGSSASGSTGSSSGSTAGSASGASGSCTGSAGGTTAGGTASGSGCSSCGTCATGASASGMLPAWDDSKAHGRVTSASAASAPAAMALNRIYAVDGVYTVRPTAVYWGYAYFDIMKDGYTVASMPVKLGSSASLAYGGRNLVVSAGELGVSASVS